MTWGSSADPPPSDDWDWLLVAIILAFIVFGPVCAAIAFQADPR